MSARRAHGLQHYIDRHAGKRARMYQENDCVNTEQTTAEKTVTCAHADATIKKGGPVQVIHSFVFRIGLPPTSPLFANEMASLYAQSKSIDGSAAAPSDVLNDDNSAHELVFQKPIQTKSECISFAGFFTGNLIMEGNTKSLKREIIPLNIGALASVAPLQILVTGTGTSVPLYSVATAKGDAIVFNVKVVLGEKKGNGSAKKDRSYVPIDPLYDVPHAVLADNHPVVVGEFLNESITQMKVKPLTFVMVHNVEITSWSKVYTNGTTRTGISIGADRCDPTPFAELNRLPVQERIELALPRNQSRMANVLDLMLVKSRLDAEFMPGGAVIATGLDAGAKRKAQKAYVRGLVGNLVPAEYLNSNRAYVSGDHTTDPKFDHSFLQGAPDFTEALPVSQPKLLSTYVEFMDRQVHNYDSTRSPNPHRLSVTTTLVSQVLVNGAVQWRQKYESVRIFAESLNSLHIYYPSWIQAAFELHPFPFQIVGALDLSETVGNMNNMAGSMKHQGTIATQVLGAHFDMSTYITRSGIPCTRGLLAKRYDDTNAARPSISADTKTARDMAFGAHKDISSDTTAELLEKDGIVAFDVAGNRQFLPAERTDVAYYALNLAYLSRQPPRAPRPDDRYPTFDGDLLASAVALTPEEGDKFILTLMEDFKEKGKIEWMQKQKLAPHFLFFAVKKQQPFVMTPAIRAAITKVHAVGAVPVGPPAPFEDMHALRRAFLTEMSKPENKRAASLTAVAPTPANATAPTLKRERDPTDATTTTADAPAVKRPRVIVEESTATTVAADPMDVVKTEANADNDDDDDDADAGDSGAEAGGSPALLDGDDDDI